MGARTLLVAALVLLAGCGNDSAGGPGPPSSPTGAPITSTTGPEGSGSTPPTSAPAACREDVAVRPGEDDRRPVVDLDGDGQPDEAWIAVGDDGATTIGVDTAAGGSASYRWESASPVTRQVLVADVDGRDPVELLASDGRTVELLAFVDCEIRPVRDASGNTYTFSLGFAEVGTGVGCVERAGDQHLVGLDVTSDADGVVEWTSTVVELDVLEARNGETTSGTYSRPADDTSIDLLHQVSCGDRTLPDDGLTAR